MLWNVSFKSRMCPVRIQIIPQGRASSSSNREESYPSFCCYFSEKCRKHSKQEDEKKKKMIDLLISKILNAPEERCEFF